MKSLKRLFLGVLLAVAAVFLVACNSKKDNGTYVFEPTKEEMKQIVPSELQSLVGDNYKVSISITINDNLKFYDYLVEKLNSNIYIKMKGNKASDLIDIGREKFKGIDVSSQCILLLEILNLLTNKKSTFDLKLVDLKTSRGVASFIVSNLEQFSIIEQSVTGFNEKEITIIGDKGNDMENNNS